MTDVYLALGSNLGDREAMLREALSAVSMLTGVTLIDESPIYETPPMGPQDQGAYLNMAAKAVTALEALALMRQFQAIESDLGRPAPDQRPHWGPRKIDIDLLLFGDDVIDEPGLSVPHPGMQERWFVLKPLADIAANVIHPVLGRSIDSLLTTVDAPIEREVQP